MDWCSPCKYIEILLAQPYTLEQLVNQLNKCAKRICSNCFTFTKQYYLAKLKQATIWGSKQGIMYSITKQVHQPPCIGNKTWQAHIKITSKNRKTSKRRFDNILARETYSSGWIIPPHSTWQHSGNYRPAFDFSSQKQFLHEKKEIT